MILEHWIECVGGDLRYTRKEVADDSELREEDTVQWFTIYDSYLAKYGHSDRYSKLMQALKKRALLQIKYILKRDPFLVTLINIEDVKIANLKKEKKGGITIQQSLIHIGKWYGSHLRAKSLTVEEYEDMRLEYNKWQKQQKAESNQRRQRKRK